MIKNKDIHNSGSIDDIFSKEELKLLKEVGLKLFAKKCNVTGRYVYAIREGERKIKSPKAKEVVSAMADLLTWCVNDIEKNKKI